MKIIQRKSPFIKRFCGPGENDIVCFRFWEAVVASGCPGECAYCFLQTQCPYRRRLYDLKGTLFENLRNIVPETLSWLAHRRRAGLMIGENQDGFAFEKPYKKLLGVTPLELLLPLFNEYNPVGHTLIVLSKFTSTQYAEAFGPSPHVVYSWSLSLPSISRQYEKKVSPLGERLKKAKQMKEEGYRIRFRLDALVPVEGWRNELADVVAEINAIEPEMVTIGALRATNVTALRNAAAKNGRDDSIFDHILDKDPSGFKYRTENGFHLEAFSRIRRQIKRSIPLGLCKEDISVWRAVGLHWEGCHCLQGAQDPAAIEPVGAKARVSGRIEPSPLVFEPPMGSPQATAL